MKIPRRCKYCGEDFVAVKTTQYYCCRSHFKRDFYHRNKVIEQKEQQHPDNPVKRCEFCQLTSTLTFNPLLSPQLFDGWGCPHCGTTNQLVWEHRNESNSYQIIQSILVTFQFSSTIAAPPHYQPYLLPTETTETQMTSTIVAPSDIIDFFDIPKVQHKRRRKVTS